MHSFGYCCSHWRSAIAMLVDWLWQWYFVELENRTNGSICCLFVFRSLSRTHICISHMLRQWWIGLHLMNEIGCMHTMTVNIFPMINFTNFPSSIYYGHHCDDRQLYCVFRQQVAQIISKNWKNMLRFTFDRNTTFLLSNAHICSFLLHWK